MKNLIFAILLFSFFSCLSAEVINAQDVFGRAKKTDTEYLDPNDFNRGEVIIVDTSGGQNVFIGQDIASSLNQPDKIVYVILDTNASADMSHKVLYATTADTTVAIGMTSEGLYEFIFAGSIFANKRVLFNITPYQTVLTGDVFDPSLTIKGFLHIPINEVGVENFYLMTTDAAGLVRRGILQPNTIIEITLYPL